MTSNHNDTISGGSHLARPNSSCPSWFEQRRARQKDGVISIGESVPSHVPRPGSFMTNYYRAEAGLLLELPPEAPTSPASSAASSPSTKQQPHQQQQDPARPTKVGSRPSSRAGQLQAAGPGSSDCISTSSNSQGSAGATKQQAGVAVAVVADAIDARKLSVIRAAVPKLDVAKYCQLLQSGNDLEKVEAACMLRKLMQDPVAGATHAQQAVASGAVAPLIQLSNNKYSPSLQLEAATILGILASGSHEQSAILIQAGALPALVDALTRVGDDNLLQGGAELLDNLLWCLGNLAEDCEEYGTMMIQDPRVPAQIQRLMQAADLDSPVQAQCMFWLGQLYRHAKCSNAEPLDACLPLVVRYLSSGQEPEGLESAAMVLRYATKGSCPRLGLLLGHGVMARGARLWSLIKEGVMVDITPSVRETAAGSHATRTLHYILNLLADMSASDQGQHCSSLAESGGIEALASAWESWQQVPASQCAPFRRLLPFIFSNLAADSSQPFVTHLLMAHVYERIKNEVLPETGAPPAVLLECAYVLANTFERLGTELAGPKGAKQDEARRASAQVVQSGAVEQLCLLVLQLQEPDAQAAAVHGLIQALKAPHEGVNSVLQNNPLLMQKLSKLAEGPAGSPVVSKVKELQGLLKP